MTARRFTRYVALGDSMSIDVYPGLDHMGRTGRHAPVLGLGAASLLHRNRDDLFPEFARRDLAALFPGIEVSNLSADGATTDAVLHHQVSRLRPHHDGEALVTLTAGGNDLLALVGSPPAVGAAGVRATLARMHEIVEAVRRHLPRSHVVVTTVYDPTDGSGRLDHLQLSPDEIGWLTEFNAGLRALARPGVAIADAHAHFLGHGLTAARPERWYWSQSPIEPGIVGAGELRRLWAEAAGLMRPPA